jgi:hypothetical protein
MAEPPIPQEAPPATPNRLPPTVWHIFGADIRIEIVDGVPHVNGKRVDPAGKGKLSE